jgi:hypothetical protein
MHARICDACMCVPVWACMRVRSCQEHVPIKVLGTNAVVVPARLGQDCQLLYSIVIVSCGLAGEPLRRFFLNEATCGVIAHSLRFVRPFKRFGAFLGYMLAGAIGVLTYRNVACRVKFDGGEWTPVPHLTVIPSLLPLPPLLAIPRSGLLPSSQPCRRLTRGRCAPALRK